MTRLDITLSVPAQIIEGEFRSFEATEQPVDDFRINEERLLTTFSSGLYSLADLEPEFTTLSARILRIRLFDDDDVRLAQAANVGVRLDLGGNLLDPVQIEGVDVTFTDFPDRLDLPAFGARLDQVEALLADVTLDGAFDSSTFDFGEEPADVGIDPELRDTLVLGNARNEVTERVIGEATVELSVEGAQATLTELDRLELTDGAYLYDLSDQAGFVYRVYQAALSRTPDELGLRFWDDAFASGALTPRELAEEFVDSPEFIENFLDDQGDRAFIDALYENVFDRPADQTGFDYWLGRFQDEGVTRADMLRAFADSDENRMLTADETDDGFWVVG